MTDQPIASGEFMRSVYVTRMGELSGIKYCIVLCLSRRLAPNHARWPMHVVPATVYATPIRRAS